MNGKCFFYHKCVSCPLCSSMLKRWPRNQNTNNQFMCQAGNPPCPRITEENKSIINSGNHQYKCFLCDYDVCKDCLQRRVKGARNQQIVQQENSMSTSRATSPGPNCIPFSPVAQTAPSSLAVVDPDPLPPSYNDAVNSKH